MISMPTQMLDPRRSYRADLTLLAKLCSLIMNQNVSSARSFQLSRECLALNNSLDRKRCCKAGSFVQTGVASSATCWVLSKKPRLAHGIRLGERLALAQPNASSKRRNKMTKCGMPYALVRLTVAQRQKSTNLLCISVFGLRSTTEPDPRR
jgi:hypothetical protein